MLLTDPNGRHTGYDTATGKVLQQIPNSYFSAQATTNIENTTSSSPADYFLDVQNPSDATYELTLIGGQDTNSYDLTMVTFSANGSRQSADELKGVIISNEKKNFQINLSTASDTSSTISLLN